MTVDTDLVKGKIGQLTTSEINILNKGLSRLFQLA